jgi:hypothetical protein
MKEASTILAGGKEIDITLFKALFKQNTNLGRDRVNDFVSWATISEKPAMLTRQELARGKNKKYIRMAEGTYNHV